MLNAVGAPQAVLLLGGASDIGLATVHALPASRLRRVVLAGRPSPALDAAAADLRARGIAGVEVVAFDAQDLPSHEAIIDGVFDAGDIDVVLLAFGLLGDQAVAEADPAEAIPVVTTNYTGAVSAGLYVARRLRAQGHGVLVVLSSIAGVRGRRANFVYGSSKAGLDAFGHGLGDALHGTGARVLLVRTGFVRSKMTAGMPDAPFSVDAVDVAAAVVDGIRRGRETVWVPAPMMAVALAFRTMPRAIFRRLPR